MTLAKENPYLECKTCKTLEDCKHPNVVMDGLGSVLPPDCCPMPMTIIRATNKKWKELREGLKQETHDLS